MPNTDTDNKSLVYPLCTVDDDIDEIEEFIDYDSNPELLDDFDFNSKDHTTPSATQLSLDLCDPCTTPCNPSCTDTTSLFTSPSSPSVTKPEKRKLSSKECRETYDKITKIDKGYNKSTTGVIRLMRVNGDEEAADLLEEIRETTMEAKRLLDGLSGLHKKRTGQYANLDAIRADRDSETH